MLRVGKLVGYAPTKSTATIEDAGSALILLSQKVAGPPGRESSIREIQQNCQEGKVNLTDVEKCEARFTAYLEGLASAIGHADRVGPLCDYCKGLILPGERKSVEPMAAR